MVNITDRLIFITIVLYFVKRKIFFFIIWSATAKKKDEAILKSKEQPQRKSILRKAVSIGDTGCPKEYH